MTLSKRPSPRRRRERGGLCGICGLSASAVSPFFREDPTLITVSNVFCQPSLLVPSPECDSIRRL